MQLGIPELARIKYVAQSLKDWIIIDCQIWESVAGGYVSQPNDS
jgi:hypothetical protein